MTGYGRSSITGEDFSVSVDIKTVNNRFLDVHLRLSSEISSLESLVKKRVNSRLSRGRVDIAVTLERTTQVSYELNRPLIAGYVNALRQIQKEFDLPGEPDINIVARLPGALQPGREGLNDLMVSGVEDAVDLAVDELEKMREQEGAALQAEMRDRLDRIESLVPIIEAAAGTLVEVYRTRLQRKIGELINRGGPTIDVDPSRLAQEVAYLADRSDVSEEMVRLRSHISQFREALDSSADTGKMLDFLLQELNREANTTLSKSTDLAIKEAGLAIKAEVEKLREQVQNVE